MAALMTLNFSKQQSIIPQQNQIQSAAIYYAQTVASMLLTSNKFKLKVDERTEISRENLTDVLGKMEYLIDSSPILREQWDEYRAKNIPKDKTAPNQLSRAQSEKNRLSLEKEWTNEVAQQQFNEAENGE